MIMMFDGALFSHINFQERNIMLQDYKLCCWAVVVFLCIYKQQKYSYTNYYN